MKKIINFFKDYWITILIFVGLIWGYKFIADNGLANAFLFPPVEGILQSFEENKETMLMNMWHSMGLLIPSIIISLVLALLIGTVIGMHKKLRKVLHPVIYTFSVVPSILLSPFVLLMTPSFWWAALILIVYGTVWATLFATITGIMTIDIVDQRFGTAACRKKLIMTSGSVAYCLNKALRTSTDFVRP